MRRFGWLGHGHPPLGCDLRRLGWCLVDEAGDLSGGVGMVPMLAQRGTLPPDPWLFPLDILCGRVLLIGVENSAERTAWLRLGIGDAVGAVPLAEIEVRALRLVSVLPRELTVGPLRLDLFTREAFAGPLALGLFPREFALLWRLTEAHGSAVKAGDLLRELWHLSFRPETNSLAVHVSRLRAKLRLAECAELIETVPGGAYRLALPAPQEFALDAYLRLREDSAEPTAELQQDLGHAA